MNALSPGAAKNAVHRLPGVCATTGLGRATIYDFVQRGLLPPALRIGSKLAFWPVDEIDRVMAARIRGASDAEIRELVAEIVAARADRA